MLLALAAIKKNSITKCNQLNLCFIQSEEYAVKDFQEKNDEKFKTEFEMKWMIERMKCNSVISSSLSL